MTEPTPKRERSVEAANRDAAGAVLRRRRAKLERKLKSIKDIEKIERLLGEVDDDDSNPEGSHEPQPVTPAVIPTAQQDEAGHPPGAPTFEMAPPAGPPPPPPPREGWPTDAKIIAALPTAESIWKIAAVLLADSRYDLSGNVELEIHGKKISASKIDALVEATAPLIAKYMPDVDTPEARAGIVVAAIFVPPALGHAHEWWTKRGQKPGGLKAVASGA